MFFLKPTGEQIERWQSRQAAQIAARMRELAKEYPGRSPQSAGRDRSGSHHRLGRPSKTKLEWAESLESALKQGREKKRAVLLISTADKSSEVDKLIDTLQDRKLKKYVKNYIFVKHPYDKEDETCKTLGIEGGGTLLVLDPFVDELEDAVLDRHEGSLSTAKLRSILKKWDRPRYKCTKCNAEGFSPRECHGAPMKK